MFDNESALNAFMVDYLNALLDGVEDHELDTPIAPDASSPRWILGHLAIMTDYALRSMGQRFALPMTWHRSFAKGTPGDRLPDPVPRQAELLRAIVEGFARCRELLPSADLERLGKPHAVPMLTGTPLITGAHVLAHLLTTHFAGHLGQLSAWRRTRGLPRAESYLKQI